MPNDWNGPVVNLPPQMKRGFIVPTPENLDRIAADAAAKRARETQSRNMNPNELGRAWGVSRDMVLFLQRIEGRILDLERENAFLKSQIFQQPPHLRDAERRG